MFERSSRIVISSFFLALISSVVRYSVAEGLRHGPQDEKLGDGKTKNSIEEDIIKGQLLKTDEVLDPKKIDSTIDAVFASDFENCKIPESWITGSSN
jgi:hypothetical protein